MAADERVIPSNNRRRFFLILMYALLLSPWIVTGVAGALKTNANSPLDWVDSNFAPRQQYDRFSSQFGAGDVVVISWPGCVVNDSRLDRFAAALRNSAVFYDDGQWLFHRVTSGREAVLVMTHPPLSIGQDEAAGRLSGSLIGPDGQTTCVMIGFNQAGLKRRGQLIPLIRAAAERYCDAVYASQHLAGPVMDGYSVDQASQIAMKRFAPLSSIIVLCVCLLCLDSLTASLLVFGVSLLCQAITLAILHYSGGTMTALLIVLPPLVQVLAIAGGIHLVNYYFSAVASAGQDNAIAEAVRVGWLPCVLSSATTAIGLGSLLVSGLVAVREFGAFAAAGVIASVAILLVFLPGGIAIFQLGVPPSCIRRRESLCWQRITDWQQRFGIWASIAAGALMVSLGFGVARLQASVRIETLFGNGSRLINDYAWLEQHVGSLVPIEVVTKFGAHCDLTPGQRIDFLQGIAEQVKGNSRVDAVTSGLSFLPRSQSPIGGDTARRLLDQGRSLAGQMNYCRRTDDGGEQWRTTAHLSALGDTDYGQVLSDLTMTLQAELHQYDQRGSVSLELSGLMPLVHEIQQQLLQDLFVSFLTAFALIAVVMTIVQAGLWAGLLSMIPNVFPALTLFGILGWVGHPIDIGSIMTASVAMGIAVDDTLHFLTFFQRAMDTGISRKEAVLAAYTHCGRAMIQTTLICGAGLAIFIFSDFVPTARFAWMMVTLLAAALVGDLVVLPGILIGPLGRVFDPTAGFSPVPSGETFQRTFSEVDRAA